MLLFPRLFLDRIFYAFKEKKYEINHGKNLCRSSRNKHGNGVLDLYFGFWGLGFAFSFLGVGAQEKPMSFIKFGGGLTRKCEVITAIFLVWTVDTMVFSPLSSLLFTINIFM